MKTFLYIFAFLFLSESKLQAQQYLPDFKVIDKNGVTVISWNKSSEELTLLIVQRSADSLIGFKSIASMPDPNTPQNGYVDKNNKSLIYYYRLFYVGINGKYYFSNSSRAYKESPSIAANIIPLKDTPTIFSPVYPIIALKLDSNLNNEQIDTEQISKKNRIGQIKSNQEQNPSVNFQITIQTEKLENENILKPNPLLFTDKDNNLMLILPDIHRRKFHLHVYKEDGKPIFQMKNIKDSQLLIDKSNFIYSGWFKYEIYEGDQLMEKGKFLISAN